MIFRGGGFDVRSLSASDVYLVFSAYQIASSSASGNLGDCATVQGPSVALSSQFSVTSPPAVDYTAIQHNATTSLINFLGFSSCAPLLAIPTDPSRSATATFPASGARKSLSPKERTATTAVGSGLFVALIIIGTLAWRKFRKRKIAAATDAIDEGPSSSSEDTQPYLQQKSELDAEEARKHELHAEEQRHELAGSTIFEMQDGDQSHEILTQDRIATASLRATHELRGEEHSKELEAR